MFICILYTTKAFYIALSYYKKKYRRSSEEGVRYYIIVFVLVLGIYSCVHLLGVVLIKIIFKKAYSHYSLILFSRFIR